MSFNIKSCTLIFLFFSFGLMAQKIDKNEEIIQKKETADFLFLFSLEVYKPYGVGSNIATKAFDTNLGWKFSFQYNVGFSGIMVGSYLNFTSAEIIDPQTVGYYKKTNISIAGFLLGYQFDYDKKWRLYTGLGVGSVYYDNKGVLYEFEDSGTSIWFNSKGSYYFTDYFGIYLSGTFRKDILSIQAPKKVRKDFNPSYVSLGFGIQFRI